MWTGSGTYHQNFGVTSNVTVAKESHVSGWGTLIIPGHDPIQALRLDTELSITTEVLGAGTTVTSNPISFMTKEGIYAEISIVPPPSGIGPTTYEASYSLIGSGGGGTQAPASEPTNLTPADQTTDVSVTGTLSWDAVPEADTYDLQVATDDSFTKAGGLATVVIDETGLTETSFDMSGLDYNATYFWRVRGTNAGGSGPWSTALSFTTVNNVAVEQLDGSLPTDYVLYNNYPNPFNPQTTIRFDIPTSVNVRLSVFDALGREVDVLVSERLNAGRYEFTWDAGLRPSGAYLYRLQAGAYSRTGTMVLLK
jgi:hypothetical protein